MWSTTLICLMPMIYAFQLKAVSPCPGCAQSEEIPAASPPASADRVSPDEIRREMLRWEREKILKQLGGPEPSEDVRATPLPEIRSVRRARSITKAEIDEVMKANDTATDQRIVEEEEEMETAIVLGQLVKRDTPSGPTTTVQCYDESYGKMGTCIDFFNKSDIKWDRFKFATLRFRLDPDQANGTNRKVNHTFGVKAINYGRPESYPGLLPSNVTTTVTNSAQYIEVDVTHQILRRALAYSHTANPQERDSIHNIMTLRITCLTCRTSVRSPISMDSTRLPFLEIGFSARKKRASPTCEMQNDYLVKDPSKRGCCMVPVDVEFSEIGMTYILHPPRYRTHYCSGRCNRVTTRSYTAVIQNVIAMRLHKMGFDDQVSLCCAPMSTNKLPIVYQNGSGVVNTASLKDMLVTACGC